MLISTVTFKLIVTFKQKPLDDVLLSGPFILEQGLLFHKGVKLCYYDNCSSLIGTE